MHVKRFDKITKTFVVISTGKKVKNLFRLTNRILSGVKRGHIQSTPCRQTMLESLVFFADLMDAQGFEGKRVTYVVPQETLFHASLALDHFAALYQKMKPDCRAQVVPQAWSFSRTLLEGYLQHAPRPVEHRTFNKPQSATP